VRLGYGLTDVGVIPLDWAVFPLIALSTKITDGEHQTPTRSPSGYYLLSARNVQDGHIDLLDVDHVCSDEYQRIRLRCDPQAGDVLISCSGTVGRVAVVPEGLECVMVRSAAMVKADPVKLCGSYLQYFLQSSVGQRQIAASLNQGAQANLFLGHIQGLLIALPPTKGEQEAIAEVLSDADALIESLEHLISKKCHLKQGAMQELLTAKKRLPGFGGEWETKHLGELILRFTGGGTPSRLNPDYWGGDIPWVTVKDLGTFDPHHSQETITEAGLGCSASHLVPAGTLITSTRMAVGRAVIYEVDVAINQDLKALVPLPEMSSQYLRLWFALNAPSLEELGSGSTVMGISLADLKEVVLNLPRIPEQEAIVAVLSDLDADIAALETKLAKARLIKQGMMQELLTGRTRLV